MPMRTRGIALYFEGDRLAGFTVNSVVPLDTDADLAVAVGADSPRALMFFVRS